MDISKIILKCFYQVSSLICLLPFIASFFKRKYLPPYLKPIFALMIISVLIEILNFFSEWYSFGNTGFINAYILVEFALIILFYVFFFKNPISLRIFYFLVPLFYLAAITEFKLYGMESSGSYTSTLESLILIPCTLLFYYYILQQLLYEELLEEPVFWINTGVLIYFSGNIFFFALSDHLTKINPILQNFLWGFLHSFFNVFYNIILTVGFWKIKKE